MPSAYVKIRPENTAKAARYETRGLDRKMLVRFDQPAGKTQAAYRWLVPKIKPDGTVQVQAFKGLWEIACYVDKCTTCAGERFRNNAGKVYRARLVFEAKHLRWL